MIRRRFTQAMLAGAASLTLSSPRRASAFGALPQGFELPFKPAESILECFLYGGLSTWESFYCVPTFGVPDHPDPDLRSTQFYSFHNPSNKALDDALTKCGAKAVDTFALATSSAGHEVRLGPYVAKLARRKDVMARMRVVVNRHDLEPHEAAIPYALCGKKVGSPTMASLGAHLSRHFAEASGSSRKSPHAYVLSSQFISSDNVRATVATGAHPGAARPLLVRVDGAARLAALLRRAEVGGVADRAAHDAAVDELTARYRERLGRDGVSLRAARVLELEQARRAVKGAEGVRAMLPPALFSPIEGELCGDKAESTPAMSLRLAAHLLTDKSEPARHVCFVDGGLLPADGGGGYDTHFENPLTQARNFAHTLDELLSRINEPGENDPGKIDLDRTMIVLNMDFGRSPFAQGDLGRNHWPYGYVQVYIGGPITQAQRGLFGAIGEDGVAIEYTTPPENRIACMLAMGIWPFSSDSFGTADVMGAKAEADAALDVMGRVLGYTS